MFRTRSIFSVGLIFSFGTCLIVAVNGMGAHHKMKCLDQDVDLKDCFKGFKECASTLMPADEVKEFMDPNTSADRKKELGKKAHENLCIKVCQWKKHQHYLNEDGSWNKTTSDAAVDKIFPEAAREAIKTGVNKCHADNSAAFKDENNCQSYKPFFGCIEKAYAEACKVDPKSVHLDGP